MGKNIHKQTDILKIEEDLNFILTLWGEKKSFSLLLALDGHHEYISDLQRHTDLFALMENKLLEIIILDTCKMFEFKPGYGISIPNLFAQAKKYLRTNISRKIKMTYGKTSLSQS